MSDSNQINVDLEQLKRLEKELNEAVESLEKVDKQHLVSGLTPELAKAHDDFESDWDEKRRTVIESLSGLSKAFQTIHDTFKDVDESTAKAIQN